MRNCISAGGDVHDKNIVVKYAFNSEEPKRCTFHADEEGRKAMSAFLKRQAAARGAAEIHFAYEASGCGFTLYEELTAAGITCYVIPPTRIKHSAKDKVAKCDPRDAKNLLELLRGFLFAGSELPRCAIPSRQLRDDRELLRMRIEVQEKCSTVKIQIQTLLKRWNVRRPKQTGKGWTQPFREWLQALAECDEPLMLQTRAALDSLLRQLASLDKELLQLDGKVAALAQAPRYAPAVQALTAMDAIGIFSALVFLVELGDLTRFKNRRQLAAFLGLAPCSDDSGDTVHKGHITHQGPPRVRFILCQAVWNLIKMNAQERAVYARIAKKNPNHKKIAVVALMRRLAIRMWHTAKGDCLKTGRPQDSETRNRRSLSRATK